MESKALRRISTVSNYSGYCELRPISIGVSKTIRVDMMICVICNKEYQGYGNNALPVKSGRCCNSCNDQIVIPTRLSMIWGRGDSSEE